MKEIRFCVSITVLPKNNERFLSYSRHYFEDILQSHLFDQASYARKSFQPMHSFTYFGYFETMLNIKQENRGRFLEIWPFISAIIV